MPERSASTTQKWVVLERLKCGNRWDLYGTPSFPPVASGHGLGVTAMAASVCMKGEDSELTVDED